MTVKCHQMDTWNNAKGAFPYLSERATTEPKRSIVPDPIERRPRRGILRSPPPRQGLERPNCPVRLPFPPFQHLPLPAVA
jgi:hypothetical protein